MATPGHSVIEFHSGYGDQSSYTSKKKVHTIIDKLQKYTSIPEEVRNKADVIYNQMTVKQHRKTKLIQLLYWCCYNAYLELNLDINPQELGKVFGLTSTEVSRCGSMFSELETGYQPPRGFTTPMNYLPGFCDNPLLPFTKTATEQCLAVADRIISKEPALLYQTPLNVACGIFKYYLVINGIQVPDLRAIVGLSDSTINPWYKVVENIDNSITTSANREYPPVVSELATPIPSTPVNTMASSTFVDITSFSHNSCMTHAPLTPVFNFV